MTRGSFGKRIIQIAVIILSAILFLVVALYNGYPLVTADCGSYIKYAFDFQLPADRSPFYGVFVGVSSLRLSPWLSLAVQSILVNLLLWDYARLVIKRNNISVHLLFIILIVACTTAGWVASFLMPDIFTAVLLIACILLLFEENNLKAVLLSVIIFIAVIMHNSHFLITVLFSGCMMPLFWFARESGLFRKARHLFFLSICSWLFVCTLYFVKGFGFTMSPGKHVFMMGKLVETGILQEYLKDRCDSKSLKLCDYRNELPGTAIGFLWDDNSPLYKTGGWDSSRTEYSNIINDIFSTPAYALMFLEKSVVFSLRQMTMIFLADKMTPMGMGSPPCLYIKRHLPGDLASYENSKQNLGILATGRLNTLYLFFLVTSTIAAATALIFLKNKKALLFIYIAVVVFISCNAFVTATFANVLDRLQYRVFWILPATNLLVIFRWLFRSSIPR